MTMRRFRSAALAAVAVAGFASVASAADMPMKAAPIVAPVATYNWTGFYIGANVGGGWGSRNLNYSPNDPIAVGLFSFTAGTGGPAPSTSFTSSGVLGGLQLGYNWQFNHNWLVGIETDFDWSGMKGTASSTGIQFNGDSIAATADEQIKWFGTVRARLGYLPADRLLTYVTGGFAYGRIDHTGSYVDSGPSGFTGNGGGISYICFPAKTCLAGSSSSVATGWTVGGGFEYALWNNLTLKAEYLYVSLGSTSLTETALAFFGGTVPSSFNANYSHTNFNVARVGLNYRF